MLIRPVVAVCLLFSLALAGCSNTEEDWAGKGGPPPELPVVYTETPPTRVDTGETVGECPEPTNTTLVPDGQAPFYIGAPVNYTLHTNGCVTWMGYTGKGFLTLKWQPSGVLAVPQAGGTYSIEWEARFRDGQVVTGKRSDWANGYAPPHEIPDPNRFAYYYEASPFEGLDVQTYTFLSNADMWHDRDRAALYWQAWYEGVENPGYALGAGGVTLNTIITIEGALLAQGGLAQAVIYKTAPSPMPPFGSCQNGYTEDAYFVTYQVPDVPIQGFSWMSRPMGCNLPEFQPDATSTLFLYEWDGLVVPPWTPFDGPDGPGYIFDEWDIEVEGFA